ncbi:MAG TPA: PKD domain-containing protein [Thermoleophilaceae bacterium]|nr:PKD domain-containing protein [Thermoleophilaceae bacterium]
MRSPTSDSSGSRRPRRRRFLIAALVAAALAGVGVFAVDALGTVNVDFSFLPANPKPGDSVTFTITTDNSDVPGAHYIWSVDGSTIQDDPSKTFTHTFATAGSYDVKVLLENGSNVPMTDMDHTVDVNTPPTAAFTFSPTTPNPGDTVSFDGTGSSDPEDGSVTSYSWDLNGDGTYGDSTDAKPTTSFSTGGAHTVSLQVTDSDGATDTISKDVTVNHAPTAAFTSSPAHPTPGATVSFDGTGSSDPEDGSVTSYSWDLNDDGVYGDSTSATPTTTFATAGPHPVSLEVTDSNGATDTVGHLVTVNAPPTADFTFTPTTPNPNDTINLDGTSSTDSDGTIASYSWDTNDDGTFGDKTGATPTISFSAPGTHTVQLRVTDNDGATDTVSKDITVNAPPSAAFTFTPTTPNPGDTINLDGTSSTDSDGTVASYSWDLNGDGTYGDSTSSKPTTSFATPGNHTVGLQVTDDNGATDTVTHTITVNNPPTAAFTSSPAHPTPGATVSFDGTGSSDPEDGSVTTYAWDLDNNGTFTDSSSATPTTTFATPGAHTVTLRVTDSNGATDTISHNVNVNAPPSAAFTSSPAHPIPGQTVSFDGRGSSDDGSIASYSWDLNDDGTFGDSTSATPSTSFATAGTHTVKLRVTDNFGATDTVTHDVTVNAVPTAAFTFTPTHPDPNQTINLDGTGSSDPEDGSVTSYSWDLNNDGTFGDSTSATPNTSFSTSGPHTVKLKVTDSDGATSAAVSQVITVNGPSAEFNWTPVSPVSGQLVTFNDTSTDTGGAINSITWDLNNDGTCGNDPGETDAAPTRSFPAPGNYTVKECVSDNHGRSDTVSHVVTVANRPPAASFVFGPTTPLPGDLVTFTSTSSDPDGPIANTAWDLNGNSVFGELGETGSVVSRSFPAPGTYPISLQVTDQNGATTKAFDSVTVLAPPSTPVKPRVPQPIDPFPIVTIRGKVTRTGVKITSLVVQTPVGTTVTIRCTGKHCPFKTTASVAKVRKLKVKKLQRSLRGDMVLQLFITQPGEIGKYTRFHIRTKGKGPVRQDKCLSADANVIQRCPS